MLGQPPRLSRPALSAVALGLPPTGALRGRFLSGCVGTAVHFRRDADGLALPMAYYLHRATTVGLPSNVIVVPLTQLLMPAAVAALALGYASPWLAKVPVLVTTFALDGITGTVRGLGALRLADLRVPMPSVVVIALAAAALVY